MRLIAVLTNIFGRKPGLYKKREKEILFMPELA